MSLKSLLEAALGVAVRERRHGGGAEESASGRHDYTSRRRYDCRDRPPHRRERVDDGGGATRPEGDFQRQSYVAHLAEHAGGMERPTGKAELVELLERTHRDAAIASDRPEKPACWNRFGSSTARRRAASPGCVVASGTRNTIVASWLSPPPGCSVTCRH